MMPNFLTVPKATNVEGLLAEMTETIAEYKELITIKTTWSWLRLLWLHARFEDLKSYRVNFVFTEPQKKGYTDLVIQFRNCDAINNIGDDSVNDTKVSLLDEYP